MRNGSPVTPQCGQTKPSAQRSLFEVFSAGGIIREEPLKLRQRLRKRQRGVWSMSISIGVGVFIPVSPIQIMRPSAVGANGQRAQALLMKKYWPWWVSVSTG